MTDATLERYMLLIAEPKFMEVVKKCVDEIPIAVYRKGVSIEFLMGVITHNIMHLNAFNEDVPKAGRLAIGNYICSTVTGDFNDDSLIITRQRGIDVITTAQNLTLSQLKIATDMANMNGQEIAFIIEIVNRENKKNIH